MNKHFMELSRWWVNLPPRMILLGRILFCVIVGFFFLHSYYYTMLSCENVDIKGLITLLYAIVMFMKPTDYATIAMREFFELENLCKEQEKTKSFDDLTETYNRNFLPKAMVITASNAVHNKHSLFFFVIDVDLLKNINDTYGHFVGDLALKATAQRIKNIFWGSDIIVKIGGDEFAVLGDTSNLEILHLKMQELLTPIEIEYEKNESKKKIAVTFSSGFDHKPYTEMLPMEMFSDAYALKIQESLYRAADAKMYEVKLRKKAR